MTTKGHNGGPPSVPMTPKTKLECIKGILERGDLTAIQKCTGVGLVVSADKEWVSEVKTADLQRMSSAKDRETVFRATKKLDDVGIVSKASAKGQTGRYNILPPKIIEAVMEAFEELQSGRAKPDGISGPVPTGNPVRFHPTTPAKPVGFEPTGRDGPDQPSRAYIETPSGLLKPKKLEDRSPFIPQGDDERITFENGRLELKNGLKQFWLEKFGDAEALDLALIQAAGYVQPNSMKPLEAQVSAQLARKVADKRDKDARYAKAVKANTAKSAEAPGESRIERYAKTLKEIEAAEAGKGGVK
jgi:hypothetical protein